MMKNKMLTNVKAALRNPYTLGSYPVQMFTYDGCICHKCVRSNYRSVVRDTMDKVGGWSVVAVEVLWEGDHYCVECCEPVESAYGSLEEPIEL